MQIMVKKQRANSEEQRAKSQKHVFIIFYSMLYALCFLFVFAYGCSPRVAAKLKADTGTIKKIAAMPFENFTADEHAHEKIRKLVITELLIRGIEVTEPGEVTRLLKELKIKSVSSLKMSEIQDIGKALDVKTVMMGSVESFGISRGISVTYPEVTIHLRLIDTPSGNIIWSVRHTTGGPDFWTRHFGSEGPSLSEAAGKVVRESVGSLF